MAFPMRKAELISTNVSQVKSVTKGYSFKTPVSVTALTTSLPPCFVRGVPL